MAFLTDAFPVTHARFRRSAVLLLSLVPLAAAAENGSAPLFGDDSALPVRIEAPLRTLARERSDTEYLDGLLYYTDGSGVERALDVKLRARGRYRRKPETCTFPPVRLNFSKGQVEDSLFAGADKLKLVTHCRSTESYEQNVLEEYLAYRILNLLTDASFRVRLLHVDWVDSSRGGTHDTRYAFLIEDDDMLEKRLGIPRAKPQSIASGELVPEQAALLAVFEYLIGNTDFSMILGPLDDSCCHNVLLFSGDDGQYLPVAYDFDFAGLVNARYAKPNPRLKIRRVTTRLYRGYCLHNDRVADALSVVMAQRGPVMALVDAVPGMQDRMRETARRYVSEFYEEMSAPDAAGKRLIRGCL